MPRAFHLCVAPRGPRRAGARRLPDRAPTAAAPRGLVLHGPLQERPPPQAEGRTRPVRSNYGKSGKGAAHGPRPVLRLENEGSGTQSCLRRTAEARSPERQPWPPSRSCWT